MSIWHVNVTCPTYLMPRVHFGTVDFLGRKYGQLGPVSNRNLVSMEGK